jgi:GR25 family glycosyltransferase involved in LPS biosynthesis
MSIEEVLKNVVYINLDERNDRNEHFLQEIAKLRLKIQPHRVPAIKLKEGAIGCSMSHIKALEYAKKEGWPYVLICEDDITFTNPEQLIISLFKTLKQESSESNTLLWDVLLIAANNWPPFKQQYENCIRVTNSCSATGYIVRQHYYDTLLQNYKEGVKLFIQNTDKKHLYALDVWWKKLQIRDRWWMLTPATVSQWEQNYSNIENTVVSYSHLMLTHDKTQKWLPKEKQWKNMNISDKEDVLKNMKLLHPKNTITHSMLPFRNLAKKNARMSMAV